MVEQSISKELRDINPSQRVLNLSKCMMTEIKNYEELTLKIGVHSGKCMMGVIGYHKPQFSLIGDTVNFTSRHCTTGDKGHIMVSEEAWHYLNPEAVKRDGWTYTVINTEMKGKGLVNVYHVMPQQGLLRKKLMFLFDRYRQKNMDIPKKYQVIDRALLNTRKEMKSTLITYKLNNIFKKFMDTAARNMDQDMLKEEIKQNIAPQRNDKRRKTVARATKMIKANNPNVSQNASLGNSVNIREDAKEREEPVKLSNHEQDVGHLGLRGQRGHRRGRLRSD